MNRKIAGVIMAFALVSILSAPAWAEENPTVISVKSNRAIINWKTWSSAYEPLHIQADDDRAMVIFRFETLPANPGEIRVTSNAAVFVETDSGLEPVTEKARKNPFPKRASMQSTLEPQNKPLSFTN